MPLPVRVPQFTATGRTVLVTSPTQSWKTEDGYYGDMSDSWEEHAYDTLSIDPETACRHP